MSELVRLMRLAEVLSATGHSHSSWYREMKAGRAPRPLKRGVVSVWPEPEIAAYNAEQLRTLPRMGQSMGAAREAKKKAA